LADGTRCSCVWPDSTAARSQKIVLRQVAGVADNVYCISGVIATFKVALGLGVYSLRAPHFERLDGFRVSQGLRSINEYENCAESGAYEQAGVEDEGRAYSG
jgi:hypothetical protein